MALEKNILNIVDFSRAAVSSSEVYDRRVSNGSGFEDLLNTHHPKRSPQHLLGLLFAHGSRTRRVSLPRTAIKMSVFTPSGKSAVKIRV